MVGVKWLCFDFNVVCDDVLQKDNFHGIMATRITTFSRSTHEYYNLIFVAESNSSFFRTHLGTARKTSISQTLESIGRMEVVLCMPPYCPP